MFSSTSPLFRHLAFEIHDRQQLPDCASFSVDVTAFAGGNLCFGLRLVSIAWRVQTAMNRECVAERDPRLFPHEGGCLLPTSAATSDRIALRLVSLSTIGAFYSKPGATGVGYDRFTKILCETRRDRLGSLV